ncbi:hypothetical protein JCGZ_22031 [Jatropha curcas]|uniref:Uncharacterized protein n=1 Tax=Jatropha curcas TaxID=180498 RepID=A0A067JT91_JATCU|nr:hypothetical protein JCGZ_22031 [Jatropha curcas]
MLRRVLALEGVRLHSSNCIKNQALISDIRRCSGTDCGTAVWFSGIGRWVLQHPSSGTSGASSSAQRPVLPPSLPSTPSSSTPVFGPVQSPPAAQSPTVQASSDPRISLSLKHFIWDEAITAMLKVAWEKICADRYADFTYRMRKSGKKQQCVSQEIWESWQKAWEDPAFKRKREIFAQNRRSETGGDGAGPSRHTGGSISAIETARLLAKDLGREPTPIEVFTYTHTKDHDLKTFVDRRVVSVNTDKSEAESRIDEVAFYLEAAGGEKKRKVVTSRPGKAILRGRFYCGSAAHASTASARPQPEHTNEHYTELRAQLDDQQRQIAELRVHVMRLSSEPGAGTSSSDPTPATDRNVSTSQQQPLWSPDPDAADDTLVTPLGTTAHPAGTPPGDSTSDRADEQPRRFDFGPF